MNWFLDNSSHITSPCGTSDRIICIMYKAHSDGKTARRFEWFIEEDSFTVTYSSLSVFVIFYLQTRQASVSTDTSFI